MVITPIEGINALGSLERVNEIKAASGEAAAIPFQGMFQDAIENVRQTDAVLNEEIYKLATGQSDDLHNITIASAKASLSVDLLVELRNKALEAYKEIMNMGV